LNSVENDIWLGGNFIASAEMLLSETYPYWLNGMKTGRFSTVYECKRTVLPQDRLGTDMFEDKQTDKTQKSCARLANQATSRWLRC
jgi:hypothetical protein